MAHGGSGLGIEGRVVSFGRSPDLIPVPRWLPIPFKPALLVGPFFAALEGRKLGLLGCGHWEKPQKNPGGTTARLLWLSFGPLGVNDDMP